MEIQALGYVGLRTASVENWREYGQNLLGLQLVDEWRDGATFRMDDRKQRIVVQSDSVGEGNLFGWEVADGAALNALAARLEKAGVAVKRSSRALAEQRKVKDLIVFADPLGRQLEAFYGAEAATDAFRPGRSLSGFRTGALGMGHIVLTAERIETAVQFYRDVLGFRLSDYALRPFKASFFHCNPRHHSLAFVETGRDGIHHLMMELFNLDDVGQAYDLAQMREGNIGATLGRHTNDLMTSFYSWAPSDIMIEYGWGGREIDPDSWKPVELEHGPSLWGHDRTWLDDKRRGEARDMRLRAASDGLRAPVNVMEGNYRLMPGTCPWWDQAIRDHQEPEAAPLPDKAVS